MNKLNQVHCTTVTPAENFRTKQIKFILIKSDFKKKLFNQEKIATFL